MGFLLAIVLYLQMVRRHRGMFHRIMLILVLLSSFFFVISSAITAEGFDMAKSSTHPNFRNWNYVRMRGKVIPIDGAGEPAQPKIICLFQSSLCAP